MSELELIASAALPVRVAPGRGISIAVRGSYECPARIRSLELFERGTGGLGAPVQHSRREFWALLDVPGGTERHCELALRVTAIDGRRADVSLGTVRFGPETRAEGGRPAPTVAPVGNGPAVVICMATHEPDAELFAAQVASIREQVGVRWHCVIRDDASSSSGVATIRKTIGDDPRFDVHWATERLGFVGNFERALELVPEWADLVALADQDDRWLPHKCAALADALQGGATLAYCDMRVVKRDRTVISPTFWRRRRNAWEQLASLLIANAVPGAASLFPACLLDVALPFPSTPGTFFHDHWIALCALATGSIVYVPQALQDYVQHEQNVLGHTLTRSPGVPERLSGRLRKIRAEGHAVHAGELLRIECLARTLVLRCGHLPGEKGTAARRFDGRGSSKRLLGWLGALAIIRAGRASETDGGERVLLRGALWRVAGQAQTRFAAGAPGR